MPWDFYLKWTNQPTIHNGSFNQRITLGRWLIDYFFKANWETALEIFVWREIAALSGKFILETTFESNLILEEAMQKYKWLDPSVESWRT